MRKQLYWVSAAIASCFAPQLVIYFLRLFLQSQVPKDKDLDAVFELADDDRSGTVDSEEFLKLYAAVKKGEVKGLGQKLVEQQAAEAGAEE